MSDFWTDDRIKTLSDLWAQGISCEYIGRQIGATKNAVIGKARRIGLSTQATSVQFRHMAKRNRAASKSPSPAYSPRVERAKTALPSIRLVSVRPVPAASPEPPPIMPRNVGIMDLTGRMCRWVDGSPVHPATFCGAECDGGQSYCPGHRRMVYTPRLALSDDEQKALRRRAA